MNRRRAALGVLAATVLLLPAGPAPALAATAPPTVRVLPLGDSITYGEGSSGGGYRRPLADLAAGQSRYALDFVGSLVNGPQADPAHEGHAGYTIDQIRLGAGRWLGAAQPDVVLLHIGINDLNQGADPDAAADRARLLLDRIFELRPGATVIMQGLIPTTPGWDNQDLTQEAARYNYLLKTAEADQQARGRHFRFVDAPDLTTLQQADAAHPAQLADGLHPNDLGYARLAGAFFAGLEQARTAGWFTGGPVRPDQPRPVTTVHLQRRTGGDVFNAEGDYAAVHWSDWSSQGGIGVKDVTSAATGTVNRVFAIGQDKRIWEKDGDYATGAWSQWFPLADSPQVKAVSASSDGNTVHLVALDTDGRLLNSDGDFTAGKWNGWWDHGVTGLKRVASATTADHVNHIVAVAANDFLVEQDGDYTTGQWDEWKPAGPDGGFRAVDVTASATDNTLHLGAIGFDGDWHNADGDFDRRSWGGWWNGGGGGDLVSIASAAANNVNHVFAVREGGAVIERDGDYSAGRWNGWATPPGSTPADSLTASFTFRP